MQQILFCECLQVGRQEICNPVVFAADRCSISSSCSCHCNIVILDRCFPQHAEGVRWHSECATNVGLFVVDHLHLLWICSPTNGTKICATYHMIDMISIITVCCFASAPIVFTNVGHLLRMLSVGLLWWWFSGNISNTRCVCGWFIESEFGEQTNIGKIFSAGFFRKHHDGN